MVFDRFIGSLFWRKMQVVEREIKRSFERVKKEFSDHLDAINENTNEIQSNYEFLVRLENKIDKMEQSISEINRFVTQFKLQHQYFIDEEQATFLIQPLSDEEKQVFRVMYELEAEQVKVTYQRIADVLAISVSLCREYVLSLIEKGIPITKSYVDQKVYLGLEPRFREIQTKGNVVKI